MKNSDNKTKKWTRKTKDKNKNKAKQIEKA